MAMILLYLTFLVSLSTVIFGQCPPVDPDNPGSCKAVCASDKDCSNDYVCCSNGCGTICVDPLASNMFFGWYFHKIMY